MEWDKLKVFYAIAEAGSFTKAGQNLNISQSALSRSIQILEYRLKTELFIRLPKGVRLTPDGVVLLERTCNMMREFQAAESYIKNQHREEPSGVLEVRSNYSIAYSWLVHQIKDFIKKFPKVRIHITCDTENTYKESTPCYLGFYIPHRDDLVQIFIKTMHTKLYASKEYLAEFGTPQTAEELDNHQLIVFDAMPYPHGCAISHWLLQLGRAPGHIRQPFMKANTAHAMFNAARNGLGITTLGPEHPLLEKVDDLVEVLPHLSGPSADLYYIYPNQMKEIKTVVEFGKYLQEKFASEGASKVDGSSKKDLCISSSVDSIKGG